MSKNIRISILGELDKATKTKIHDELKRIEKSAKIKFKASGLEGIKKDLTSMQKMVDQWASKGFIGKESINKTKMDIANTKAMYREMFNDIRAGEQIGLKHEKAIMQERSRLKANEVAQAKAQNKVMEQNYKAQIKQQQEQVRAREVGLKRIETIENRVANMKIGKESLFTTPAVMKDMEKLTTMMTDFKNKGTTAVKDVNKQYNQLQNSIKSADKQQQAMNSGIIGSVKKMLLWSIAATAIYAPIRSFKQGLATLKEIDTELVNIAKVTNMTKNEMKDLANEATKVGIAYGRTVQEFLSGVTEFARAGYGENATRLAELSLLLQNTGDVSSDMANQMLIAVDAAYGLGGSIEELTKIIDMVNEVDKLAS
jgi:Asp-tRNA(Asn)/Glu-tRNA(Gln) amidotransferase C subunit